MRDFELRVADSIIQITGCTEISDLIIYNAFTPGDDDDFNRLWNIPGIENYSACIVKVFNAWGNEVFSSPVGYPEPWDGKLSNGKIKAGMS